MAESGIKIKYHRENRVKLKRKGPGKSGRGK